MPNTNMPLAKGKRIEQVRLHELHDRRPDVVPRRRMKGTERRLGQWLLFLPDRKVL